MILKLHHERLMDFIQPFNKDKCDNAVEYNKTFYFGRAFERLLQKPHLINIKLEKKGT